MGTLAEVSAGLPYGWSLVWQVAIEGIEPLWVERVPDGASGSRPYVGALVMADRQRVGAVVDRRTGIGRGFDLVVRLRDQAETRALVADPAYSCHLAADLGHADATATVDDTTGWPSSGTLAVGRETMAYSSKTATTFAGLSRGLYGGPALDHSAGVGVATRVDSAPRSHIGRRVVLSALAVDPYGRWHGDEAEVWAGAVVDAPQPDGLTWVIRCEPIDRQLARPVWRGVSGALTIDAANGDAHWEVAAVEHACALAEWGVSADLISFFPFSGRTVGDVVSVSDLRDDVAAAALAASTAAGMSYVLAWAWREDEAGRLRLYAQIDGSSTESVAYFLNGSGALTLGPFALDVAAPNASAASQIGTSDYWAPTAVYQPVSAWGGVLAVRVDDGDPGAAPTEGWVVVEGAGGADGTYRYTDAWTDAGVPGTLYLQLAPDSRPPQDALAEIAPDAEPTATLAYQDSGPVADVVRRMLASTGTGTAGTWDILDAGYAAPIDEAGIAAVLGGAMSQLAPHVLLRDDATFEGVFGGLLALARRAIVARPLADGSGVAVTAVRAGLSDTSAVAATITDADLTVSGQGGDPIRAMVAYAAPASIRIETRTAGGVVGHINVTDVDRLASGAAEAWDLRTEGLSRGQLEAAAAMWAQLLMVSEADAQIIEADVGPMVSADVGDVVALDVRHVALWSPATGERGYSGRARVLGATTDLATGIRTLTLILDGRGSPVAWAPSAAISSYTGPANAPATIAVHGDADTWADAVGGVVRLVRVGDDGTSGTATVDSASGTVLTLSAHSAGIDLSAGTWHVQAPELGAGGTAAMDSYAHDGGGDWA